MSDNWIVGNLQNAINTWNGKLGEIWQLVSQTPENFKGRWYLECNCKYTSEQYKRYGLALLVIFFLAGVIKTCNSFSEVKKPEHAFKLFLRFAIAYTIVVYGLDLMLAIFKIVQGISSTIMSSAGFGNSTSTVIPPEIISAIESCRILREYSTMGDYDYWWTIYNCTFICNDNECVW